MGSYLTPLIVSITLPLLFALFRRWLPRNVATEPDFKGDEKQLPYGVAGTIMWALALTIAVGGYFALRFANHLSADPSSIATVFPEPAIWCFLPGFAACLFPWLFTLYLLRRFGYSAQAARIVAKGDQKLNLNGERLMRWMTGVIIAPLFVLTLLALPMHLSVLKDEVSVTHYAHVSAERYPFADARRAYLVDGYTDRDGSFHAHPDLLIDFRDGRRLSANAVGDGGTEPSAELMALLLSSCRVPANHVRTAVETHK